MTPKLELPISCPAAANYANTAAELEATTSCRRLTSDSSPMDVTFQRRHNIFGHETFFVERESSLCDMLMGETGGGPLGCDAVPPN